MRSQTVLRGLAVLAVGIATLAYARTRDGDGSPRTKAEPENVLVKFRPGIAASERDALHRKHGHQVTKGIPQLDIHVVRVPPGKNTDDVIARYRNHPLIEFVEPERLHEPALIPDDPYYPYQWHLSRIEAQTAWDSTVGSSEVIIAILDTGVDGTLPELEGKLVPGWNFFEDNADTSDVLGHGTRVAGTATVHTNNGAVVASVAWDSKIMPIRISDANGWASDSTIAAALVWAADHGARIANISFDMLASDSISTAASYFSSNSNGVVIFAAGNGGVFDNSANDPHILGVAATDRDDQLTSWSDRGNNIDLTAPGVSIYTISENGGVASTSGTSHAAPIVAGVAALVVAANPALDAADIRDVLTQSADDLGIAGWDSSYGWGRVNAAAAVDLALNHGGPSDNVPPTASFAVPTAGSVLSGITTVLVDASDNVAVTRVDLLVDGSFLSSDTVPPHEWAWDTSELTDGEHVLSAVAHDAAGNVSDAASVQVTTDNAECLTNADCQDGQYCNGSEICLDGTCQAGTAVDCSDGINCTVDACDEVMDACTHIPNDVVCHDGNFCNGAETCDPQLGCRAGDDPCPGQLCDEGAAACVDCLENGDCGDSLFCNGVEVCIDGSCAGGADPCPGQLCDEAAASCRDCLVDGDCDDGLFCNGVELCIDGFCADGVDPCPGQLCGEGTASCVDCLSDGDCGDGLFCNGVELCIDGFCADGADPCPGQFCAEATASCVDCLSDGDCDDGLFCNGGEACVDGFCTDGGDPCPGQDCDEAGGVCLPLVCDGDGVCDPGEDCNVCPGECFSGSMAVCGNGLCEIADGEDCLSCPEDCNGLQTGGPSGRYCCGGGNGVNPVGCEDPRCSSDGNVCTATPGASTCCGDLVCEGSEDSSNCAVDCPPSPCGNGVCDPGEDCHSCPEDCAQSTKARRIGTYCCGNGIIENGRETGALCDGNP